MGADVAPIKGNGLLAVPDGVWDLARLRADVIAPLSGLGIIGKQAADEASQELGVSGWNVYVLIKRCREGGALVTNVAPRNSCGGRGKGWLIEPGGAVIEELVRKEYLSRQSPVMLCSTAKSFRHGLRGPFRRHG